MTKEIENIILNKEYIQLTPEEKELIHEFAETEVDFEQLKFVLMQVNSTRKSEMPKVDKSVKGRLDSLFDQTYSAKRLVWYNRLWLFLWPEETRIYARPMFQLATMVVLILGVVTFVPFSSTESRLALNEPVQKEYKIDETSEEFKEVIKEVEVVESPQEEAITEKLADNKVSQNVDMNSGRTLSDETVAEDVFIADPVAESLNLSSAGAAYSSANNRLDSDVMMDEVVSAPVLTESVALTKSVTASNVKAISPKDQPEIFDVLTALF